MAARRLNLPDSKETLCYRALTQVLRDDPVLRRIGVKVRAWEGNELDTLEPKTLAELPLIRLDPDSAPSEWLAPAQHRSVFPVRISIAVPSVLADDILNLWGAVRAAIWPQDDPERTAIRTRLDPVAAALTMKQQGVSIVQLGDMQALVSDGVMSFVLHLDT